MSLRQKILGALKAAWIRFDAWLESAGSSDGESGISLESLDDDLADLDGDVLGDESSEQRSMSVSDFDDGDFDVDMGESR